MLLSTKHQGIAKVMTMAWHRMLDLEPPLVVCVDSRINFSFVAPEAAPECTLHIATEQGASIVHRGNMPCRWAAKFEATGL